MTTLRDRYDELAAATKGKHCVKCKAAPQVAWIEGNYKIRCECWPDPPTMTTTKPHAERMWALTTTAVQLAEVQKSTVALQELKSLMKVPKASDLEIKIFARYCASEGLNPFGGEAFLIPFGGSHVIVIGVTAYARRAAENPNYAGMRSGVLVQRGSGISSRVVEVEGTFMLRTDLLLGGWAEVHGKGWAVPYKYTVTLQDWDRSLKGQSGTPWESQKATMIKKVAESQALRRAMPKVNVGPYADMQVINEGEEISQTVVSEVQRTAIASDNNTPAHAQAEPSGAGNTAFNGYCPVHGSEFELKSGVNAKGPYKFWACSVKVGRDYCKRRPQDWLAAVLGGDATHLALAPELVKPPDTAKNIAVYLGKPWRDLEALGMATVVELVRQAQGAPQEDEPELSDEAEDVFAKIARS